ncbi:CPBP family intramembrane metalloprotease, partial [Myxococcota bacterium]|nr:CPBP family intramembrane metalloprotease [Myxococcota bacterium]
GVVRAEDWGDEDAERQARAARVSVEPAASSAPAPSSRASVPTPSSPAPSRRAPVPTPSSPAPGLTEGPSAGKLELVQPSGDLAPKKGELDRLFGSMDLDLRSAVPLVTGDLTGSRSVESTRFPLALAGASPAKDVAAKPGERSRLAKLKGTVDLFLDRIEPLITGDFLFQRRTADLEPPRPEEPKRTRPRARTEDLVVVDNILGDVDIVVDVRELIEQAASSGSTDSVDVAHSDTSELSKMIPDVAAEPISVERFEAADPRLRRDAPVALDLDDGAQLRAITHALTAVDRGRFEEAGPILQALLEQRPTSTELVAAWAFVRFSLETDPSARFKLASELAASAEAHPFCSASHGYLGRMYVALDRPLAAIRALEVATELEPDRADLRAELQHARDVVALRQGGAAAVLGSERSRRERALARLDAKRLPWVFVVFAAVCAAAFVPAIVLGWGASEVWLEATDPFPWARGLLLVVAGALGARLLIAHRPLAASDFELPVKGTALAIVLGVLAGAFLPVRVSSFPLLSVLVVTVFRALSEEVFLRVFVGRALRNTFVGTWTLALVSGLLYAVYQLSTAALWQSVATPSGVLELALVFGAGTAFGLVHAETRSLAATALCHVAAAVVLGVASAP